MSEKVCAFCMPEEFIAGRIIYEGELIFSALSRPKLSVGHAIVVPRRHFVPGISQNRLTDTEILAISEEKDRLEARMLDSGLADGVVKFQKTMPYVLEGQNGTKMDHLHEHVVPCKEDSDLYRLGMIWGDPTSWSPLDIEVPDTAEVLEMLRP